MYVIAQLGRRIPVLWIIPTNETVPVEPFRPWLYERMLHMLYFGRAYYWTRGIGATVAPVHFGLANRYIDVSTWRDEGGSECSAGGYHKAYKIVKTPTSGPILDITVGFQNKWRSEFKPHNERKTLPACNIWLDSLKPWWSPKGEEKQPDYYDYGDYMDT